jgi:hypothetical protein
MVPHALLPSTFLTEFFGATALRYRCAYTFERSCRLGAVLTAMNSLRDSYLLLLLLRTALALRNVVDAACPALMYCLYVLPLFYGENMATSLKTCPAALGAYPSLFPTFAHSFEHLGATPCCCTSWCLYTLHCHYDALPACLQTEFSPLLYLASHLYCVLYPLPSYSCSHLGSHTILLELPSTRQHHGLFLLVLVSYTIVPERVPVVSVVPSLSFLSLPLCVQQEPGCPLLTTTCLPWSVVCSPMVCHMGTCLGI